MNRRRFLTATGTVAAATVAGCVDYFGGAGERDSKLAWFAVDNWDTEDQTFEWRILRDGERVHSSSADIPGATDSNIPGHVAECTWNDSRGKYTILVRVEDGDWAEYNLAEDLPEGTECTFVSAEYSRFETGDFNFHTSENTTQDCSAVEGFEGGCNFANEM